MSTTAPQPSGWRRPSHAWSRSQTPPQRRSRYPATTTRWWSWLARRRDLTQPPGGEVAGFGEYAHLYHEAWSMPWIRWLLSTVPSSMIFDDHDVRDDWNTSQAWRDAIEQQPWWRERIRGALVSYWVYQHIGNLAPEDLATDELFKTVTTAGSDTDVAGSLREFADRADTEVNGLKGARWSYRRDFGRVRLLVIDTRSGRILRGGARSMLSDEEFDWVEENALGEVDHLLIGSSLPWLMPHAIHHAEALNEQGARAPGWVGQKSEELRQAIDLEHCPAFRGSSARLARLIQRGGQGECGAAPATICVVSGDVHHSYSAGVSFPVGMRSALP